MCVMLYITYFFLRYQLRFFLINITDTCLIFHLLKFFFYFIHYFLLFIFILLFRNIQSFMSYSNLQKIFT